MNVTWSALGVLPPEAVDIRTEVFVREQGFTEEFDRQEMECYHALLLEDGKAIGTARMFWEADDCMHIGRVALRKAARSGGRGSFLLNACCDKARELGAKRVILGAQCRVAHFYEFNGFHTYGDIFFDEYCEHIMMERTL